MIPGNKTLNFEVEGGRTLSGTVVTHTSKNGAVALLCASLLNKGTTTLRRCPKIEEVHRIIEVLGSIGVHVEWQGDDVIISPPEHFALDKMNQDSARKTRSVLMFIGPLIHEFPSFDIPLSGGCKLGSRTVRPHVFALERLGISIATNEENYHVTRGDLQSAEIIMYESGDTATINALLAAARIPGTTVIKYASANYQVQEICAFLRVLGVTIDGVGTTTLHVTGIESIKRDVDHVLSEDPTDAMFFLAAAVMTRSEITIKRAPIDFLELELLVLEKMGFKYSISKRYESDNGATALADITTEPSELVAVPEKIAARPYPGLNMDNLPFFAVIATQAKGQTLIHDWVYEKRALYYTELDKLGADTVLADPHRIFINGPTPLKPADLTCPPALRPATILLVGMLAAKGRSILRNVYSINRGYADLVDRLDALGAKVTMEE